MIFPGMDPYLEEPQLWMGFHSRAPVYLADQLQPQLHPRFVAAVEERVYLQGVDRDIVPDVWLRRSGRARHESTAILEADVPVIVQVPTEEIREKYITILDVQSGQKVVTVIELVSPTNKFAGDGRHLYLDKQKEVLASDTNLVEIDLLRTGPHVLAVPEGIARRKSEYDYLVSVNRAGGRREQFELYFCSLRKALPRLRIPLLPSVDDVTLDLQAVVAETYAKGSYQSRIDYKAPCRPPLSAKDQAWAKQLIKTAMRKANGSPRSPKKRSR